ncbi:hypothetical protein HK405_003860 [Cladochytrium tenue]|nr:hypothetical protein HK405_003860 [Cladochytrium tenue]
MIRNGGDLDSGDRAFASSPSALLRRPSSANPRKMKISSPMPGPDQTPPDGAIPIEQHSKPDRKMSMRSRSVDARKSQRTAARQQRAAADDDQGRFNLFTPRGRNNNDDAGHDGFGSRPGRFGGRDEDNPFRGRAIPLVDQGGVGSARSSPMSNPAGINSDTPTPPPVSRSRTKHDVFEELEQFIRDPVGASAAPSGLPLGPLPGGRGTPTSSGRGSPAAFFTPQSPPPPPPQIFQRKTSQDGFTFPMQPQPRFTPSPSGSPQMMKSSSPHGFAGPVPASAITPGEALFYPKRPSLDHSTGGPSARPYGVGVGPPPPMPAFMGPASALPAYGLAMVSKKRPSEATATSAAAVAASRQAAARAVGGRRPSNEPAVVAPRLPTNRPPPSMPTGPQNPRALMNAPALPAARNAATTTTTTASSMSATMDELAAFLNRPDVRSSMLSTDPLSDVNTNGSRPSVPSLGPRSKSTGGALGSFASKLSPGSSTPSGTTMPQSNAAGKLEMLLRNSGFQNFDDASSTSSRDSHRSQGAEPRRQSQRDRTDARAPPALTPPTSAPGAPGRTLLSPTVSPSSSMPSSPATTVASAIPSTPIPPTLASQLDSLSPSKKSWAQKRPMPSLSAAATGEASASTIDKLEGRKPASAPASRGNSERAEPKPVVGEKDTPDSQQRVPNPDPAANAPTKSFKVGQDAEVPTPRPILRQQVDSPKNTPPISPTSTTPPGAPTSPIRTKPADGGSRRPSAAAASGSELALASASARNGPSSRRPSAARAGPRSPPEFPQALGGTSASTSSTAIAEPRDRYVAPSEPAAAYRRRPSAPSTRTAALAALTSQLEETMRTLDNAPSSPPRAETRSKSVGPPRRPQPASTAAVPAAKPSGPPSGRPPPGYVPTRSDGRRPSAAAVVSPPGAGSTGASKEKLDLLLQEMLFESGMEPFERGLAGRPAAANGAVSAARDSRPAAASSRQPDAASRPSLATVLQASVERSFSPTPDPAVAANLPSSVARDLSGQGYSERRSRQPPPKQQQQQQEFSPPLQQQPHAPDMHPDAVQRPPASRDTQRVSHHERVDHRAHGSPGATTPRTQQSPAPMTASAPSTAAPANTPAPNTVPIPYNMWSSPPSRDNQSAAAATANDADATRVATVDSDRPDRTPRFPAAASRPSRSVTAENEGGEAEADRPAPRSRSRSRARPTAAAAATTAAAEPTDGDPTTYRPAPRSRSRSRARPAADQRGPLPPPAASDFPLMAAAAAASAASGSTTSAALLPPQANPSLLHDAPATMSDRPYERPTPAYQASATASGRKSFTSAARVQPQQHGPAATANVDEAVAAAGSSAARRSRAARDMELDKAGAAALFHARDRPTGAATASDASTPRARTSRPAPPRQATSAAAADAGPSPPSPLEAHVVPYSAPSVMPESYTRRSRSEQRGPAATATAGAEPPRATAAAATAATGLALAPSSALDHAPYTPHPPDHRAAPTSASTDDHYGPSRHDGSTAADEDDDDAPLVIPRPSDARSITPPPQAETASANDAATAEATESGSAAAPSAESAAASAAPAATTAAAAPAKQFFMGLFTSMWGAKPAAAGAGDTTAEPAAGADGSEDAAAAAATATAGNVPTDGDEAEIPGEPQTEAVAEVAAAAAMG